MPEKKEIVVCPFHSGFEAEIEELCRRCTELNAVDEKQWTSLKELGDETKKKASNKTIMWGIGIMVVVLIAVLGVMWRGQDSLAIKLSESERRITSQISEQRREGEIKLEETNKKLDSLKENTIELKTKVEHYLKSKN
jgi:uncharacterized membrane protein YvbJ